MSREMSLEVEVDRKKALETLRANLARHETIFAEARKGFALECAKHIERETKRLAAWNPTGPSAFYLHAAPECPNYYGDAYKTAIEMLEWSDTDTIRISTKDFRTLIQDQWDWFDNFISTASKYSASARSLSGA